MISLESIKITSNEANQRLDRFLRKYLKDETLSEIYKMVRKKAVRVNGAKVRENYRLSEGDVVEIYGGHERGISDSIKVSDKDFSNVYEDENILIVSKPPKLILHPDAAHKENTLVDQVLYYLYKSGQYDPEKEMTFTPAAVNRLDLNTGGIVMFAKNYKSLQDLSTMVRERYVGKHYICVVKGSLSGSGEIRGYLAKDHKTNIVKIYDTPSENAREIHTRYNAIKSLNGYSLLEIDLITGRSHQIRAHLSSIGHPILGDMKYGDEKENKYFKKAFGLENQLLYAYKVTFNKTTDSFKYLEGMSFKSDLPALYGNIIKTLFDYKMV